MGRVKLFGRLVEHPFLKALVLFLVVLFALLLIPFVPLLVPLHFLLVRLGRNGFYFDDSICVSWESFYRRSGYLRSGGF